MEKSFKYQLDNQLFAESETDENQKTDTDNQEQEEQKEKGLTQQDIDDAVAKARKVWESELQEKQTEAQKLSKMNKQEREEYQTKQKEAELSKREAELNRRELMATAKETLISKGLPVELAVALNYTDADSCNQSIEAVGKVFQSAVQSQVEAKIKGGKALKSAGNKDEMTEAEAVYNAMMGK